MKSPVKAGLELSRVLYFLEYYQVKIVTVER